MALQLALHLARHGFVRCEGEHELAAAHSEVLAVQAVVGLASLPFDVHQSRVAQDGQVMRHRWLRYADLLGDLAHGQSAAAAQLHDALTRLVGDGLREDNSIRCTLHLLGHIDERLSVAIHHIDKLRCVKGSEKGEALPRP